MRGDTDLSSISLCWLNLFLFLSTGGAARAYAKRAERPEETQTIQNSNQREPATGSSTNYSESGVLKEWVQLTLHPFITVAEKNLPQWLSLSNKY